MKDEEEFGNDDEGMADDVSEREEIMDGHRDSSLSRSPVPDVTEANEDALTKRNRFSTASSADDEEPRNLTIDVEHCNSEPAIKEGMAVMIESGPVAS